MPALPPQVGRGVVASICNAQEAALVTCDLLSPYLKLKYALNETCSAFLGISRDKRRHTESPEPRAAEVNKSTLFMKSKLFH